METSPGGVQGQRSTEANRRGGPLAGESQGELEEGYSRQKELGLGVQEGEEGREAPKVGGRNGGLLSKPGVLESPPCWGASRLLARCGGPGIDPHLSLRYLSPKLPQPLLLGRPAPST